MIVEEAVALLPTLDPESEDVILICARRPFTPKSECVIFASTNGGVPPAPPATRAAGFEYLIDVPVALEVLEAFRELALTAEERVDLIVYYGEYDAYPQWACERLEDHYPGLSFGAERTNPGGERGPRD